MGGSASLHAGIPHPQPLGPGRHLPGPGTLQSRHPPEQSMLGDTVNELAVRILLECNLVGNNITLDTRRLDALNLTSESGKGEPVVQNLHR